MPRATARNQPHTHDQILEAQQLLMRRRRAQINAQNSQHEANLSSNSQSSIQQQQLLWYQHLSNLSTRQPKPILHSWSHSSVFCQKQLLSTELNGWCCDKGKAILPVFPPFPPEIINAMSEVGPLLSHISRKLNNLFCFSVIGVTGGFRQLPTPSNVAISGQVYHQLLDVHEGQYSIY